MICNFSSESTKCIIKKKPVSQNRRQPVKTGGRPFHQHRQQQPKPHVRSFTVLFLCSAPSISMVNGSLIMDWTPGVFESIVVPCLLYFFEAPDNRRFQSCYRSRPRCPPLCTLNRFLPTTVLTMALSLLPAFLFCVICFLPS